MLAGVRWTLGDLAIGVGGGLLLFTLVSLAIVGPFVAEYGDDARETLAAQAVAIAVWDATLVGLVVLLVRRRGCSFRDLGLRFPPDDGALQQPPRRRGSAVRGLGGFPTGDRPETPRLDENGDSIGRPRWAGETFPRLGGEPAPAARPAMERLVAALWKPVVLGWLASYGVVLAYGILIEAFGIDELQPSEQLSKDIFGSDLLIVLFGVSVIVAAPLAEEIFFRGFLFAGLLRSFASLTGLLAFILASSMSGLLFALAHADIGFILPFAVIGVILARVYERTGTLYAAIGVHLLFNAVSFLLMLLFPEARG